MHKSTHRGDVKYEPYQEQNNGSVACHTTKTMNEGEIAQLDALYPMKQVLSDSKKQMNPQQAVHHEREHPQGGHEGPDQPGGGELRQERVAVGSTSPKRPPIRHHRFDTDDQDLYEGDQDDQDLHEGDQDDHPRYGGGGDA